MDLHLFPVITHTSTPASIAEIQFTAWKPIVQPRHLMGVFKIVMLLLPSNHSELLGTNLQSNQTLITITESLLMQVMIVSPLSYFITSQASVIKPFISISSDDQSSAHEKREFITVISKKRRIFFSVDNLINYLNLARIYSCFIHLASPVFNTLQLVTEQ